MAVYSLHKELDLAASLEELWDFISSPSNLEKITPPGMGFKIRTPQVPSKIYPGLMITYRISPFWGIRMTWVIKNRLEAIFKHREEVLVKLFGRV